MHCDPKTPVGDLVAARLGRYKVFADLGIDFCCGGHRPLDEAARLAGQPVAAVIAKLEAADAAATSDTVAEPDWRTISLAGLTTHIEQTHHDYMKKALPRLAELMTRVVEAHSGHHPALVETAAVFAALQAELEAHLQKEEQILFPMIRTMEATRSAVGLHCNSVKAPIGVMEHEHDNAGAALRRLRELTEDYTTPADACPSYQALLDGLAEMESDLHLHIHKENNILHPRAADLEAALTAPGPKAGKGEE